jgi:two-component system sensor histidine kinase/response regulator
VAKDSGGEGRRRPDPKHVDMEGALLNMDGDVGLYRKVAEMFIGDAPGYLAQFRTARAGGDRESAARAVHTLKSLAANVGAGLLEEHARALETSARNDDEQAIAANSSALEQELARVITTFKGFLSARAE